MSKIGSRTEQNTEQENEMLTESKGPKPQAISLSEEGKVQTWQILSRIKTGEKEPFLAI
jgi:hypothetical protein